MEISSSYNVIVYFEGRVRAWNRSQILHSLSETVQNLSRIDRITQRWVRASGRKVSFEERPWLCGPVGRPSTIADRWLTQEAERIGGTVVEGIGLLGDIDSLSGVDFNPSYLARPIVDFYERTVDWKMEVSHKWSPTAWPFGWIISALFTKRLQQLNFPLRNRHTALGINSRILTLLDRDGSPAGVAWMRTLPATGQYMYSGWYGILTLPGSAQPSLRVVFPLPNGSLIVLLRPELGDDGRLILISPLGDFGDDGAYLVVADPDELYGWVRRIPLAERFVISVTDEVSLCTEHDLSFFRIPIIRFNYRLKRGDDREH